MSFATYSSVTMVASAVRLWAVPLQMRSRVSMHTCSPAAANAGCIRPTQAWLFQWDCLTWVTPLYWQSLLVNDSRRFPHCTIAWLTSSARLCWRETISMSAKHTQFSFPLCRSFLAVNPTLLLTLPHTSYLSAFFCLQFFFFLSWRSQRNYV